MASLAPVSSTNTTIGVWGDYDSIVDANGRILILAKYLAALQNIDGTELD